jgi:hippurate hydrolase
MLASVDTFKIRLKGKGGHAAMPHATHDVIPAAAQLVLALQTLVSRETDPMASAVLSVTNLTAGTGALNVIGDAAKLSGTVRTFNSAVRDHLEARMGAMTESVAATFGVQGEFEYTRILGPTINEPESTRHCEEVATAIVGADKVEELPAIMGGEDFGGFLEERPGAFIALGQSEPDANCPHNKGLHSPQYDFNDAILPIAANYFVELAERRLAID